MYQPIIINGQKLQYLNMHDFNSPDVLGSAVNMQPAILLFLERLCVHLGKYIAPTSAFRTVAYNTKIKGAKNSAHLRGYAIDLPCDNSYMRYKIISFAMKANVPRLEVGANWIHIDFDPSLPQKVIFLP